MQRPCFSRIAVLVPAGLVAVLFATQALAVKSFRDEFKAKYIKPDSQDAKDVALRDAFDSAGCNVCHAGESKEERNTYGKELAKLLDRKADAKNKEKIQAALEKVAGMKSEPKDPKSPTFGELIRQGKLPAGAK
jgi:hypothetical protein